MMAGIEFNITAHPAASFTDTLDPRTHATAGITAGVAHMHHNGSHWQLFLAVRLIAFVLVLMLLLYLTCQMMPIAPVHRIAALAVTFLIDALIHLWVKVLLPRPRERHSCAVWRWLLLHLLPVEMII